MQSAADNDAPASLADAVDEVPVFFNPLQEGFFDDPYAHYAQLREHEPVHQSLMGVPICFGYSDIRRVLTDTTATSMDLKKVKEIGGSVSGLSDGGLFPTALLGLDDPDHSRIRRLMMSRSFTPRRVNALSDWITAEVDRLLDDIEQRWRDTQEPIDLVSAFAFPLPFKVISDLIGMPPQDHQLVREWAQAISAATDPSASPEAVAAAHDAYVGLSGYVTDDVLPWKRANPTEDLLTGLQAACDEGQLSEQELLDQVCLLYVAGHETTVSLIANSILNLLDHRQQLELLQSDPALLTNAVEELNRFDSAIQFAWRYTLSDFTVGDTPITPGKMVLLCIGSANRDPDQFGPSAGQLDITRANANEAMSFGAGNHFCLGNALARKEGAIAIGRFFERFPKATLAERPQWQPKITFRAVNTLDVAVNS